MRMGFVFFKEEEEGGKKERNHLSRGWITRAGEGGLEESQRKQRGDGVLAAGQTWQAAFMN